MAEELDYKSIFAGTEIDQSLAASKTRNLLVNSNFANPVNQRGLSSYPAGSARHTIDMWRATAGLGVELEEDGILIQSDPTSSYSFSQYLTPENTPAGGEVLTAAVMSSGGGVVFCGSVTMPASGYAIAYVDEYMSIRIYAPTDTANARFVIMIAPGGDDTFGWAALYRGRYTFETLPTYKPRSFVEELLECQRYYYRVNGTSAYISWPAFFSSVTAARVTIALPVQMASTPTVSTTVANLRLYDGTGKYLTPTAISFVTVDGCYLILSMTVSDATAYAAAIMRFSTNTVMEISCEPTPA